MHKNTTPAASVRISFLFSVETEKTAILSGGKSAPPGAIWYPKNCGFFCFLLVNNTGNEASHVSRGFQGYRGRS